MHAGPEQSQAELTTLVRAAAHEAGFDLVGIAPAVAPPPGLDDLYRWLDRGYDGQMQWMAGRREAYADPARVMPNVRSIVMVALNYRTSDPAPVAATEGRVSRYAWSDADYHDVIRQKLKQVAAAVHAVEPDCRTRGVVDTAPLLERDFARLAGLGWFGKNTLLINKYAGSWLFLGALLIDRDLDADQPHDTAHCGTCTRCLDVCPTDAFPEPYVLDARRCIAYLNIELRDEPVPASLRSGMQDWVFGCDLCQEVCPWNRRAPQGDAIFAPRSDLTPLDCVALLELDEAEFEARFAHTPLARSGRGGLLRNAAIVLGNSGDAAAAKPLTVALSDQDSLVRGASAWALAELGAVEALPSLRQQSGLEQDPTAARDLSRAIDRLVVLETDSDSAAGNRS